MRKALLIPVAAAAALALSACGQSAKNETAEAIAEWEPRFAVQRVQATEAGPGRVTLSLTGTYQPNGQPLTLDGLVIA